LRNISNETSNGKYRSQSRHVSGDLIGPKGEWLASTDPYNTTVFVGGLTSDITEEMLWDLFIYFGPIYYVCITFFRSGVLLTLFRLKSFLGKAAALSNMY